MEISIMGAILALVSIAYVTLASWSIGQIGNAPQHLAFSLASGLSLVAAAICGIFSKTRWKALTLLGILLFGAVGIVLAMPSITLTMIAMDREDQECEICEDFPLECNRLCRNYESIHVGLLMLTFLVHIFGCILWSSTCTEVYFSIQYTKEAADYARRSLERSMSEVSNASSNSNLRVYFQESVTYNTIN